MREAISRSAAASSSTLARVESSRKNIAAKEPARGAARELGGLRATASRRLDQVIASGGLGDQSVASGGERAVHQRLHPRRARSRSARCGHCGVEQRALSTRREACGSAG
jgi:hypothetical protein